MDEDYPAVGTEITARVAGWAGHQLRLVGRPIASEHVPSATSVDDSEQLGLETQKAETPKGLRFRNVCPAVSYSPTPSQVQYHRRSEA